MCTVFIIDVSHTLLLTNKHSICVLYHTYHIEILHVHVKLASSFPLSASVKSLFVSCSAHCHMRFPGREGLAGEWSGRGGSGQLLEPLACPVVSLLGWQVRPGHVDWVLAEVFRVWFFVLLHIIVHVHKHMHVQIHGSNHVHSCSCMCIIHTLYMFLATYCIHVYTYIHA